MSSSDGIFMSIAVALGPESLSFEEARALDYIKAYQTTGRPPPPCPQEPTDELLRKTLNLPPLFKPTTLSLGGNTITSSAPVLGGKPKIINPADLPPGQEFRLTSVAGEKYHSISCMSEYEGFSHEELRYYAYKLGNIKPPVPVAMYPFIQPVTEPLRPALAAAVEDQLQSICAQPQYNKHSPEELRVAYLLFRRDMTSAELLQHQNPPAALSPPPPTPTISIPPSTIPPPIFASAAPSVPKFTFGFK